ncbi:hypothetical protein IQ273_22175 [Nodosilinea sp. LEGE 07298]|uniref:hypothetical protein n=1 Tax=Nodosilinea sp. LEGE 07298 TaxID=2777970 RepID=UPI00187F3680|nr:hypothetical protein [Nodosilinea sp. LEGE 07298]MBE9112118.1 hypothetical protein [Nodosilinea sp. LEGE 07298]
MSFQGYMTAHTFSVSRACRTAHYCHRRILPDPLMLVMLTLGAQPFSTAAVAWGRTPDDFNFAVAGDPRNPRLLLNLLERLAEEFNPYFEGMSNREDKVPQVLVPNQASVEVLWQIHRRCLANQSWIPESVSTLGKYLRILTDRASFPGQQLLVPINDLVNHHWAFPLPTDETQRLSALDAYIEPTLPGGGFETLEDLDRTGQAFIGPHPTVREDRPLQPLLETFNGLRVGATDLSVVRPLLGPIEDHYQPLLRQTWDVCWRCVDRERQYPEATYVERRWLEDCGFYRNKLAYVQDGNRFSTRTHPKAAAGEFVSKEAATTQVQAEEAIADPLKMLPFFAKDQAVLGTVVSLDLEHRERVNGYNRRRPRLVLALSEVCRMSPGTKLWWTGCPDGNPWDLREIIPPTVTEELYRFVLVHENQNPNADRPEIGQTAIFSVLNLDNQYQMRLPQQAPWTHQPGGTTDV